uniref:N-lysine methyltransferase setd6 isoform X3 n=1 Tax=Gasterosteus aculeatus aculeatus TaxID=481459 RepID=UPI001A99CFD4|nr:N-lysine methyltransferase setd6 isoform X3 [Gasterosteus aculeatus aculeatus]
MASHAKRPKIGDGPEMNPLPDFLQWCKTVGLVLCDKVRVSKEGTVAEFGMLATDNIEEGEVLFTVPRSALLHQDTTEVSVLLEKERSSLQSPSGWVPLLLALLYEYTSPQSRWRPYLSLWTDFKTLDHPMFWSKEERHRLLRATGVPEAVDADLANIQREYTDVVLPFVAKHPDLWDADTHTLELYTQLVAFVMAYSFQEPDEEEGSEDEDEEEDEEEEEEKAPNPPMMVPMADMLNHVSNHNANLEFTPDSLKMVCVRPIRRGEEVFNTYGQMANWQLLHMYGFTEPHRDNRDDTADIPVGNFCKVAAQGVQSGLEQQLVEEKQEVLCQVMRGKEAFVFGKQGCLTDFELHSALKVLCMSEEEFSEFKDNEGWEEDEDEDISLSFSNEGLSGLKASWKWLIHGAARLTLRSYGEEAPGGKSDQELMEDRVAFAGLSSRRRNALQVRCGQKSILHRLMELTGS